MLPSQPLHSDRQRKLRRNLPKIYALNFFVMFMIVMPIFVPFLQSLGLNMTQVFILQAFFAGVVMVMEIPTGYFSDLYGRKKALLVFAVMWMISSLTLAFSTTFWHLVAFEFFAGIAASFVSGSDTALLYDTLEELKETDQDGTLKAMGNKTFYAQIGETLASLIGGALAIYSLRHPTYVQVFYCWIPLILVISLTEPNVKRLNQSQHQNNWHDIWHEAFHRHPLTRWSLLAGILSGSATLVGVWVIQKYWLNNGVALTSFGWLWAAFNLTVALSGALTYRIRQWFGLHALVVLAIFLPPFGYLSMATLGGSLGIACGLVFSIGRGWNQVAIYDLYNSQISGAVRASINSIYSLGVRGLFVIVGPIIGWIIDHQGISLAFIAAAVFYVLLGLWIMRQLWRHIPNIENA